MSSQADGPQRALGELDSWGCRGQKEVLSTSWLGEGYSS